MHDADDLDHPAPSQSGRVMGAIGLVVLGAALVIGAAPLFREEPVEEGQTPARSVDTEVVPIGKVSVLDSEGSIGVVGEDHEIWPLPKILEVPAFSFTERSGDTVTNETLEGRVWVVDFIFTSCAGTCPIMSAEFAQLHAQVKPGDDAACVSITVDPERDTLEILKEYAARYNASTDRWLFLRGPVEDVLALSYKGFKIGDEKNPMIHSGRAVLVDRDGWVRGYYDCSGSDADGPKMLARHYRRLVDAGGR